MICPAHALNWQHLGMIAAHRHDDAATCGATGAIGLHSASIHCAGNYPSWLDQLR